MTCKQSFADAIFLLNKSPRRRIICAPGCPAKLKGKMKTHIGNLNAEPGKVYEVEKITGYLNARKADANAFPVLAQVGGNLDARDCPAGTFPVLAQVGGSLYAEGCPAGAFAKVKTNCERVRKDIFDAFKAAGFHFADGILAKIVASKGRVYRVVIVGQSAVSYVVEGGDGIYSHGATLREARESLIYKIGSRDTTPFKSWTLETKKPLGEMIGAYRAITGACEQGVRNFVESKGVTAKSLTVADAIALTTGSYRADEFKKFFERA